MAHPNKKEGVTGHNDKLRRMTRDYGAANASMFKTAKGELPNGPQKDYGFGSEANEPASSAKGDRARRSSAANPIPTYKKGGRVAARDKAHRRSLGGSLGDLAGIALGGPPKGSMFAGLAKGGPEGILSTAGLLKGDEGDAQEGGKKRIPLAEAVGLGRAKGGRKRAAGGAVPSTGVIARADGGRVRKPAATNINIIVSPGPKPGEGVEGAPAIPPKGLPPIPPSAPPAPPGGPLGAGPGGPGGPLGGPLGMMPPPGAVPPGLGPMRKRGGRVHPDAREDRALVKNMVKPAALRARGGRMTAGAESGPGRLEKASMRRQSGDKSAEV